MTSTELKNDPSYSLLLMLPHDGIFSFVQEQFSNRTCILKGYIWLNILLMAGMVLLGMAEIWTGKTALFSILKYLGIGTLAVLTVLIPVHEAIHGLAYKLVGAPSVSYGANWEKYYFYAVADRFVVKQKFFTFIALLPFVLISLVSLTAVFFVSIELKWMFLGILFVHTTACAGDFAMLGFYEKHRQYSELLTFDDVKEKRTYFYVRE